MADSRMTGLALMAVSVAAFVGTTSEVLPSQTFFPALGLFGLGAIKFIRTNHVALEKAEKRAHRAINPIIRENRHAQHHAERQAARQGQALTHLGASDVDGGSNRDRAPNDIPNAPLGEIEIGELTQEFVVGTDVSFPLEVQSGDALADQLQKLNQLLEQGVLTAEEYAVAKTKLLS